MSQLDERVEIRLAGEGGQGVILAGIILAEAATLEGKQVVQVQNYGPEARGGASTSDVIIADQEIDYPAVLQANILVALNQTAFRQFSASVRPDGWILVDEDRVDAHDTPGLVRLPLARLAFETSGRTIAANLVALGALAGLTEVVSRAALEKAMRQRVPPGTQEMNCKALEAGFLAVQRVRAAQGVGESLPQS